MKGSSNGDGPGIADLWSQLSLLSAPEAFAHWAAPYGDFGSCWDACGHPDWLIWVAARMSRTGRERRPVVGCAATIAEAAVREVGLKDWRVLAAIDQTEKWSRGQLDAAALLSAWLGALDAGAEAEILAAQEAAQAHRLHSLAPRWRLSSANARLALTAQLSARAARRRRAAALAAGWAACSAGQADGTISEPVMWAGLIGRAAGYAVSTLSASHLADAVADIRSRLSCPAIR